MGRSIWLDPLQSFRFAGLGDLGDGLMTMQINSQSKTAAVRRAVVLKDQRWLDLTTKSNISAGVVILHRCADLALYREKGNWEDAYGRHIWFLGAKPVDYSPFHSLDASDSNIVIEELVISYTGMAVEDKR